MDDAELLAASGLPGPRANLTVAARAAAGASADDAARWLASGEEYLALCAAIAFGHLRDVEALRALADDPRWRVREGVAMGLQAIGDADFAALLALARDLAASGSPLQARAAAAGLCEPRLLRRAPDRAVATVAVLDASTALLAATPARERRADGFKALRKGLGYCWSVALAEAPPSARTSFERLAESDDPDVRWVVRENLRKSRLARADPEWTAALLARVSS